jgi:response regulator RpfG family c-di-GMP phosphodiesterase
MTLTVRNALLVGQNFQSAQTLTERLRRWKFRCHFAANVRAASEFLAVHPVDLLLSNAHLLDGSGYRLLMNLARLPVSAFLCFPVENSCLWLPAVDGGKRCLGLPALRPSEFARALEEVALRLSA